jgi:large conductance mechanosensitive channel
MPIFGHFMAGINFKELKIQLSAKEGDAILYGNFIQNIVDFLIIAISVFAFISIINNAKAKFEKKKEEVVQEPVISETDKLLTEIRDLLKNK